MKKVNASATKGRNRLVKIIANILGFALLAPPMAMTFAGCNKSGNQGIDLYSVDVENYNGIDLTNYENAIAYQNQLATAQDDSAKCLSEEKAVAYSNAMYSIGDEYAHRLFIFDTIDEDGNKRNALGEKFSATHIKSGILSKHINFDIYKDGILFINSSYENFIEYYGKDKIASVLDSNDYVSEKDFINGYVSFLNGYYDNATNYILSNYTRYEDLTSEQINEILNTFEKIMSSSTFTFFQNFNNKMKKYNSPISFDETSCLYVIPKLLSINNEPIRPQEIVDSIVENFYPADLICFEQSLVNYWQECIDPLFQENLGYTWTDCVKLTENPDLHPIDWSEYTDYLALVGMSIDDLPMPTVSDKTPTQDDANAK